MEWAFRSDTTKSVSSSSGGVAPEASVPSSSGGGRAPLDPFNDFRPTVGSQIAPTKAKLYSGALIPCSKRRKFESEFKHLIQELEQFASAAATAALTRKLWLLKANTSWSEHCWCVLTASRRPVPLRAIPNLHQQPLADIQKHVGGNK